MADAATILGKRMTFQEYLQLSEEAGAEYVDGRALMSPPPSVAHQQVCSRLIIQLDKAFGSRAVVVGSAGWQLQDSPELIRIPDVMVLADAPSGLLATAAPLVAVEVLSSNRSDDLVRKAAEYLLAGAAQYWVVDVRDGVLDVFGNAGTQWEPLAQLTADTPRTSVDVAGLGAITLDLGEILPCSAVPWSMRPASGGAPRSL